MRLSATPPPVRTRPAGRIATPIGPFLMPYYRYRTPTMHGPWRDSRLKAECDAVGSGVAEFAGGRGQFQWKVEGEIETQAADARRA